LGVVLDTNCRAEHVREVVVDTVDDASLKQALADLREGSGGELTAMGIQRPKFHSAFSSCALVVNVFGPWRLAAGDLELNGESGFRSIRFEGQRPIFSSRATPPNLDVLIESPDRVVGIESKLTEYLKGNERSVFADRYDQPVRELAHDSWRDLYELLRSEPRHFHFLVADQLVKHYLGLRRAQQRDTRPATLTYLYWEPANAAEHGAFDQHRREADDFARRVEDPTVTFEWLAYPELWKQWERLDDGTLHEHIARLRERYETPIVDADHSSPR
jgi:hypothetical protein